MKLELDQRWTEFCGKSITDALSSIEKNNARYKNVSQQYHVHKNIIMNDISQTLTDKQKGALNEFFILLDIKQKIERKAIYSQGVCDSFALTENFR